MARKPKTSRTINDRVECYATIIRSTQADHKTVRELMMDMPKVSNPSIKKYCDYLEYKGYLIAKITIHGKFKTKTKSYKALKPEYDATELTMLGKAIKEIRVSQPVEQEPEPKLVGRIIRFEKDRRLIELFNEQSKATRQSRKPDGYCGLRVASC